MSYPQVEMALMCARQFLARIDVLDVEPHRNGSLARFCGCVVLQDVDDALGESAAKQEWASGFDKLLSNIL
jgi:hypothetical protein